MRRQNLNRLLPDSATPQTANGRILRAADSGCVSQERVRQAPDSQRNAQSRGTFLHISVTGKDNGTFNMVASEGHARKVEALPNDSGASVERCGSPEGERADQRRT